MNISPYSHGMGTEGGYLEPDTEYGFEFLEAIKGYSRTNKMEYKNKRIYEEEPLAGNKYREDYYSSINRLIDTMETQSYLRREKFMSPEELVRNSEAYREKLVGMLGFPLTVYKKDIPNVKREFVARDDMLCHIKQIRRLLL